MRALTTTLPTVGVLVRLVPDDGCGPAEGQVPFGSHGGGGRVGVPVGRASWTPLAVGPNASRWPYVWRWALVNWLVFAVHPAQTRPLRRLRPRDLVLPAASGLALGMLDERLAADSPARRAGERLARWLGMPGDGVRCVPGPGSPTRPTTPDP